jgi:hypothetical protein
MDHLVLFLLCILTVEIFEKAKFIKLISNITLTAHKVSRLIPNERISDHWKELLVPYYALSIMKYSLKILFLLLSVILLFGAADYFVDDFFNFILSLWGIIESLFFVYLFITIKKFIK